MEFFEGIFQDPIRFYHYNIGISLNFLKYITSCNKSEVKPVDILWIIHGIYKNIFKSPYRISTHLKSIHNKKNFPLEKMYAVSKNSINFVQIIKFNSFSTKFDPLTYVILRLEPNPRTSLPKFLTSRFLAWLKRILCSKNILSKGLCSFFHKRLAFISYQVETR